MNIKHTPGPWVRDDDWIGVETKIGSDIFFIPVATIEFPGLYNLPDTINEQEANARLIAAAPELLEACRAALEAFRLAGVYSGAKDAGLVDRNGLMPLHNQLAFALNKAKGEA